MRSRHDLGENRGEISTISAPRRDHGQDRGVILRRDTGNPGGQKCAPILCEIREISVAKNAPRFSPRSPRDTEISAAKTRQDREVISRRDMEIPAGSFAARSRWESCWDSRRETKFLAVKILLLSRREAKFPAVKIGSMTI